MMNTSTATQWKSNNKYDPCKNKPYNRYNIYYMLERERFLQSKPNYKANANNPDTASDASSSNIITGYENLDLPDLPQRYAHLNLAFDWYMPGKRKAIKRDHKKSHGLASFQEIARLVADGYRVIDDETLKYVTTVAAILKQRHEELKKMKDMERLAEMESSLNFSSYTNRHETRTHCYPWDSCRDWSCHEWVCRDWVCGPPGDREGSRKKYHTREPCRDSSFSPKISDLIVNSQPTVDVCFHSSRNVSDRQGDCSDITVGIKHSPIPLTLNSSEVDIPDQDIMAMWNHY
mmetsp:Transcript_35325/g.59978  ORF Transcript_35325/g.59978 Transcript_35325/m.59978 type:complete len:290 (+) Transcript_35325:1-870(+)